MHEACLLFRLSAGLLCPDGMKTFRCQRACWDSDLWKLSAYKILFPKSTRGVTFDVSVIYKSVFETHCSQRSARSYVRLIREKLIVSHVVLYGSKGPIIVPSRYYRKTRLWNINFNILAVCYLHILTTKNFVCISCSYMSACLPFNIPEGAWCFWNSIKNQNTTYNTKNPPVWSYT